MLKTVFSQSSSCTSIFLENTKHSQTVKWPIVANSRKVSPGLVSRQERQRSLVRTGNKLGERGEVNDVRKDIRLCAVTRTPENALEQHQAVWREGPEHSYSVPSSQDSHSLLL